MRTSPPHGRNRWKTKRMSRTVPYGPLDPHSFSEGTTGPDNGAYIRVSPSSPYLRLGTTGSLGISYHILFLSFQHVYVCEVRVQVPFVPTWTLQSTLEEGRLRSVGQFTWIQKASCLLRHSEIRNYFARLHVVVCVFQSPSSCSADCTERVLDLFYNA